jgi:hypothetical protein
MTDDNTGSQQFRSIQELYRTTDDDVQQRSTDDLRKGGLSLDKNTKYTCK